jgi:hypothetical protein
MLYYFLYLKKSSKEVLVYIVHCDGKVGKGKNTGPLPLPPDV